MCPATTEKKHCVGRNVCHQYTKSLKWCAVPKLYSSLHDGQQCLKEELLYQSWLSKFIEQEITLSKALKCAHCYQAIT